jgi:hypothetical protein
MSVSAITSTASAPGSVLNFKPHKKGAGGGADPDGGSVIGQVPFGAGQGLLANLVQSLQQTLGISPAPAATSTPAVSPASATTAATNTAATTGSGAVATPVNPQIAQDLHSFLHSLFKALRDESQGASGNGAAGAAATTSAATTTASTATGTASYQGNIVSSVQALIGQLSGGGAANAATTQLQTAFNRLSQDVSAAAGTGTATASTGANLQQFLTSFLQDLQSAGSATPSLVGANVNAKV